MSFRKQLDKLVDRHVLSEHGKEWITCVADPFHDYEHPPAGYPDADGSNSVVMCLKYTLVLKAPEGTGDGTWDAHVFSLPIAETQYYQSFKATGVDGAHYVSNNDNQYYLGLLNCATNITGGVLIPGGTENPLTLSPIPPTGDAVTAGNCRIIAAGYEVHNTTAEMNKQGLVYAYTCPMNGQVAQAAVRLGDPGPWASVVQQRFPGIPADPNAAMFLRGTRVWKAADGAYVPLRLNGSGNPFSMLGPITPTFALSDEPNSIVLMQSMNTGVEDAMSAKMQRLIPFNTSGTFFTGLSPTTTLAVTLRVFVEKAPNFSDAALAALATPSAPYDVAALSLYASMIHELPVAVDVNQNAKGDWWRSVMKVVSGVTKTAAPIVTAFNPVVGGALQAAGTVAASNFGGKATPPQKSNNKPVRPVKQPKKNQGRAKAT